MNITNPFLVGILGQIFSFYASIKHRRFLSITFDGTDWIHKIYKTKYCFEKPNVDFIQAIMECESLSTTHYSPENGAVILDIGAGIGEQIPYFSRIVGSSGRVFAVEAQSQVAKRLRKTIKLNNLSNVEVLEFAISDKDEEGWIEDNELSISNRYFNKERNDNTKGALVVCRSLDSVIDELGLIEIDLVKMNIEGAEVLALEGFKRHIRKVNHWVISCHDFLFLDDLRTFEFVSEWFKLHGLAILENPYSKFRRDFALNRYPYDYQSHYIFAQSKSRQNQ